MAFTWTWKDDSTFPYGRYGNDGGWSGATITFTSSFANVEGALYLAFVTVYGSDATAHTHSVSGIGGTAVADAEELIPGSNPDTLWFDNASVWSRASLWKWRGTGVTGTLTLTLDGALDNDTGDGVALTIVQVTAPGDAVLDVIQSKAQNATNATASVTLDNAVRPDSECLFFGAWVDVFDTATPGSGWTELEDSFFFVHHYAQYEPTPSGAQNGAVSAIASQANWSAILEVGLVGHTGWGIPIR